MLKRIPIGNAFYAYKPLYLHEKGACKRTPIDPSQLGDVKVVLTTHTSSITPEYKFEDNNLVIRFDGSEATGRYSILFSATLDGKPIADCDKDCIELVADRSFSIDPCHMGENVTIDPSLFIAGVTATDAAKAAIEAVAAACDITEDMKKAIAELQEAVKRGDFNGKDGTSITWNDLTDEQKKQLKGEPGEDGKTPVKGVDYFDGKDGGLIYPSYKVDPHNMHLYSDTDTNRVALSKGKHLCVTF